VRAAELGLGVHEMKSYVARADVEQWGPLVTWLTGEPDSTLSPQGAPPGGAEEPAGEAAAEAAVEPQEGGEGSPLPDGEAQASAAAPEAPEAAEEAAGVDLPAHAVAVPVG